MAVKVLWLINLSFLVVLVSAKRFHNATGLLPSMRMDKTGNISAHQVLAPFYDLYLGRNVPEYNGTLPNRDSIHFLLYTSRTPEVERHINIGDKDYLLKVGFNKHAPTKFICHGYMSDYLKEPADVLRRGYFKAYKFVNIFVINWAKMAGVPDTHTQPKSSSQKSPNILYIPPANTTEIVGSTTADMVAFLVKEVGVHLSKIHLIGHSLGAHAMGYAGLMVQSRLQKKVPRITALDPAAPCFETFIHVCSSGKYRAIEKTDAQFVDAIHTHGKALGMINTVGHADFYPNGGYFQPRCSTVNLGACSHQRAIDLMAESITHGRPKKGKSYLRAQNCTSWETYKRHSCDTNSSAMLGEFCSVRVRGKYFLDI